MVSKSILLAFPGYCGVCSGVIPITDEIEFISQLEQARLA